MGNEDDNTNAPTDPAGRFDKLVSCCLQLIDVLQGACTQTAEAATGPMLEHEHRMFDDIDMREIAKIQKELLRLSSCGDEKADS